MEKIGTAVVGGGVVGCAVLNELAEAGQDDIFLFEKLPYLGEAQSGRNSGVVHAGIYYATGSLKARLCVEGNRLMYDFCRKHEVPCENVGKLVVASSDDELPELEKVFEQAKANGVPEVRMLDSKEVRDYEPNVQVPAAIHCPTTGIVDSAGLTNTLARLAQVRGAQVMTGFEITHIEPSGGDFEITGTRQGRDETFRAEVLINSAGLYSDMIAKMVNPDITSRMAPLRGEYYKFSRKRRENIWLNGYNIYPVPERVDIGGLEVGVVGVHLTPTFGIDRSGNAIVGDVVTVGPEFVYVTDRENYEEGRKPAEFFLERANRFFPGLKLEDLEIDYAGIMANLRDGTDFIITKDDRHPDCIQLIGIDSPGLTCSLVIAEKVREMLGL